MEIIKSEDISTGKRHGHRRYNDAQKCYKALHVIDKWKYEHFEINEDEKEE